MIKLLKRKGCILLSFFIILSTENFSQANIKYLSEKSFLEKTGNIIFPAVELLTFESNVLENSVNLSWQTKTEINSNKFVVERMISEDMTWINLGEVSGSGRSSLSNLYSFIDKNLEGGFYSYRLKMIDSNGKFKYSTEIHTEINQADNFELSQNYPNPFNPSTVITYKLSEKTFVSLKIYNVLGNEITTLIHEEKPAGIYNISFDVSELKYEISNGTYFYRLKAGDYTETKKMIYIK